MTPRRSEINEAEINEVPVGEQLLEPTTIKVDRQRQSILPRASLPPRPARRRVTSKGNRVCAAAKPAPAAPRPKAPHERCPDAARARELLALYAPIVRQIVGGFQRKLPRSVLREDLIAAGMSGLWDAIRRHGSNADGEGFEWYARVRVRGAIVDELRAQDWLPRRARAAACKQKAASETSAATPALVRIDDVSEWEQARSLTAHDSCNGEDAMDAKLTRESLSRAVEQLPERERYIVSAHYFQGVKFKQLGVELGVSEPRISQLHSRAMSMLRSIMQNAA